MNRTMGLLAVVWLAAVAAADDKPKADEKAAPADRLAAIQKDAKEAETELYKKAEKLGESKDEQKKFDELYKEYEKGQVKRFEAALELAKADPKSDAGFDALEWLLTSPRAYHLPVGKPAMELALEHHAANPKIARVALLLGQVGPREGDAGSEPAWKLIRAVAEKNPDKTARGSAAYSLANSALQKFAAAEYKKQKDTDELAGVAEKAFEQVVAEYGECKMGKANKTLGEAAKTELFELRNLRVGKTAPDVEGEDLDGVKFKLSDYKGKVVVLDFWGDW